MPTPFDWTPLFGIECPFTSASNPTATASLNKAYSETIGKDELSEFFVNRDAKEDEGPLEIAPDPQLHILNCVAKAIAISLIDPDEVTKDHIANLLSKCVIKHVRSKGSTKRMSMRFEPTLMKNLLSYYLNSLSPIGDLKKWRPDLFMQAYTGDPPSATASRARFAKLLQQTYTKPNGIHQTYAPSSSGTTDLITNNAIDPDDTATPSNSSARAHHLSRNSSHPSASSRAPTNAQWNFPPQPDTVAFYHPPTNNFYDPSIYDEAISMIMIHLLSLVL
eukprot:jgi/Psemu1/43766/gm1.43766_g